VVTPKDSGLGTLGPGSPTPGSDLQDFDFDVTADLTGRVFYRDWAALRSDGVTPASLTVDPTDSFTRITAYRDWAFDCANPTRGATFGGTGRLDTGDLVDFQVATCDNGAAGSGLDYLRMVVFTPGFQYDHSGLLSSGDVKKTGTATIIFQEGFENGIDPTLWKEVPAGNGRYSVSTDPLRIHSGTHSLEVLFGTTGTYATWGELARSIAGVDEIYVKFSVLFEENFNELKGLHMFVLCGNGTFSPCTGNAGHKPTGTDRFYAGLDPEFVQNDATLKPLHFYTYWPEMECPLDYDPVLNPNCFGNDFYQTLPKTQLVPNQWQSVVMHVKMNTAGPSCVGTQYDNGSQELWIEGVQKISIQNMCWRTTSSLNLNSVRLVNYMSSGPKVEHLWIDDITVWRP
jgi:hypothetical protein